MSVGPWCSGLGEHLRAADWTFPFLKLLTRSTNLIFFVNFIVKGLSNRPQSDGFEEHPNFNLNFNISTVEVLDTREANPRWFWGGRAKQPKKNSWDGSARKKLCSNNGYSALRNNWGFTRCIFHFSEKDPKGSNPQAPIIPTLNQDGLALPEAAACSETACSETACRSRVMAGIRSMGHLNLESRNGVAGQY